MNEKNWGAFSSILFNNSNNPKFVESVQQVVASENITIGEKITEILKLAGLNQGDLISDSDYNMVKQIAQNKPNLTPVVVVKEKQIVSDKFKALQEAKDKVEEDEVIDWAISDNGLNSFANSILDGPLEDIYSAYKLPANGDFIDTVVSRREIQSALEQIEPVKVQTGRLSIQVTGRVLDGALLPD
jgi:hypothetical protein